MEALCEIYKTINTTGLSYDDCISLVQQVEKDTQGYIADSQEVSQSVFILLSSFMIMFMQAGFAMLEAGAVRARNAKSILIKNLLDLCVTVLVWWLWGFALFSNQYIHIGVLRWNDAQAWIHTVCFCSASATIISGSIAERMKMPVYLVMIFAFSGLVYPLTGYWVWNEESFLKKWGYLDFAGGAVVHMSGGVGKLPPLLSTYNLPPLPISCSCWSCHGWSKIT
jgi:ammonia channel protein AmtB